MGIKRIFTENGNSESFYENLTDFPIFSLKKVWKTTIEIIEILAQYYIEIFSITFSIYIHDDDPNPDIFNWLTAHRNQRKNKRIKNIGKR